MSTDKMWRSYALPIFTVQNGSLRRGDIYTLQPLGGWGVGSSLSPATMPSMPLPCCSLPCHALCAAGRRHAMHTLLLLRCCATHQRSCLRLAGEMRIDWPWCWPSDIATRRYDTAFDAPAYRLLSLIGDGWGHIGDIAYLRADWRRIGISGYCWHIGQIGIATMAPDRRSRLNAYHNTPRIGGSQIG